MRPAYLTSLALLPVACALLLLPPTLPAVAAASVLGGFSATGSLAAGGVGGVAFPLQTAVLADLLPADRRTRWFSLFTFFSSLAAAAGTLAGGAVDLPTVFALALALSLVGVVAAIPVPVRPIVAGRRPSPGSRAVIRRFTVTGVLNGLSQGLLTPFLIPFFVLAFGVARSEMSVYATASSLLGTGAVLLAPWLDARWGFVRSIVGTRLVAAALAIALPFSPFVLAVALYMALPAFRVAALPAQTNALMGRLPAADRSEGAGTNQAARITAASGGTVFGGFALDDLWVGIPFLGYALALIVNAGLYVRFFGWDGQRIPTTEAAS